jgi:hypothetical protein
MMFQKSFPIAGDPPLPRIVAELITQGCQRNEGSWHLFSCRTS